MKKILALIALVFALACNNESETRSTASDTTVSNSTMDNTTNRDTAGYDRINDHVPDSAK